MDYAQLSQSQNPSSPSISDEYIGMSDEEELKRWANFHSQGVGLGEEVLVDMTEDVRELFE